MREPWEPQDTRRKSLLDRLFRLKFLPDRYPSSTRLTSPTRLTSSTTLAASIRFASSRLCLNLKPWQCGSRRVSEASYTSLLYKSHKAIDERSRAAWDTHDCAKPTRAIPAEDFAQASTRPGFRIMPTT